jgi:hypothetical protein
VQPDPEDPEAYRRVDAYVASQGSDFDSLHRQAESYGRVTMEQLIALKISSPEYYAGPIPLEFQRRLIESNAHLQAAIEASKVSADRSSTVLIRLTRVLVWLTAFLVAFTVVLVVLTIVLLNNG